ncbi:MAG TPA: hypothetical protein VKB71_05855 [Rhizomicrobium sp.]|nr:hypothetical protein [Rhizomicrobium sp.]
MIHFLILHVTVLLIVAFFVLFAASKADGIVRLFGNILGLWLVLVAVLHIVGFFVPGALGMKGMHEGMMHDHWMHHMGDTAAPAATPATVAPSPAATPAPATPAPATPAKPATPAPKKS